MTRREARIKAFEQIYQNLFINKENIYFNNENLDNFTLQIINTVEQNKETLLKQIKDFAKENFKRIYYIDLALILMATSEINYNLSPKEVAVNEAVEIAKIYSTEESPNFINGFLKAMNN